MALIRRADGAAGSDELEHGSHLDAALQAASDRAEARVDVVHPLDLLAPVLGHREPVVDRDSLEHQHAVAVEYLADRFDPVSLPLDFDLTRLQRACERAGQSAPGRRHDVVKRGRLRREVVGGHPIVVGHF